MSEEEGNRLVSDRQIPFERDERLRNAFQALSETSAEELSAADVERVWQAVAGELPAEERRELVDRMSREPALAEAWRAAQELRRAAAGATDAATAKPRFWTTSWLAAAAVLLIGVAAGIALRFSPFDRNDTFRGADHYVIEPLVPQDTALPREAFRLRWNAGPPDTRYQVRVTTEDLRLITSVSDLGVPELVVDPSLLSSLAPGARLLWQVEATLPGGGSVSSQTFIARVQ
jgi:hypothetical protein